MPPRNYSQRRPLSPPQKALCCLEAVRFEVPVFVIRKCESGRSSCALSPATEAEIEKWITTIRPTISTSALLTSDRLETVRARRCIPDQQRPFFVGKQLENSRDYNIQEGVDPITIDNVNATIQVICQSERHLSLD